MTDYDFQFTRHLMSCNNIDAGKSFVGKDYEPSASIYGIIQTALFSQLTDNTNDFNSDIVFISNLLRTWITAVLLYGLNKPDDFTLKLCISPFIKEHLVLMQERGNFQKDFKHTILKFILFLDRFNDIYKVELPNKPEDSTNLELYEKTGNNLPSLPKTIIFYLPNVYSTGNQVLSITFNSDTNKYEIPNIDGVVDTVGPNTKLVGFTQNGDLQKFMDWFVSVDNYYKDLIKTEMNKIHVVTHSNAMQTYLKKIIKDLKKEVTNTNSWLFITKRIITNGYENEILGSLKKGIPGDKYEDVKKYAMDVESTNKALSLCGVSGSVSSNRTIYEKATGAISTIGRIGSNILGRGGKRITKKSKKTKKIIQKSKRKFTRNKKQ